MHCTTISETVARIQDRKEVENKRKHLEFIQGAITRMANTSFLLKGWSITVVAGLFAFSASTERISILVLAIVLNLVFWFLDSYYLRQERMYRALYDEVRKQPESTIDFSMDASRFADKKKWYKAPFSISLWPFYTAALAILVVFLIIFCKR